MILQLDFCLCKLKWSQECLSVCYHQHKRQVIWDKDIIAKNDPLTLNLNLKMSMGKLL